jgi:hypothetical protein
MVYIDSHRAKAIQDFKAQVIQDKLQPYCSFIEQRHWSERLLIQCYHDNYYQQYYSVSKQQRQQDFWQQWQKLKPNDPFLAGLYAIRTAQIEGVFIDPPETLYPKLQKQSGKTEAEQAKFFGPLIGGLLNYYQEDESQWTDDLKMGVQRIQQHITCKLTASRNWLYHHSRRLQKRTNKERYRLWQLILICDQREADHLARLSEEEYRQTDYWQVLTQGLKSKTPLHCRHCDGVGPLQIQPLPPEYRGLEILLPKTVTFLCPHCHSTTAD